MPTKIYNPYFNFAYGLTRMVFIVGPYAIKIPSFYGGGGWWYFLKGLLANMQEYEWSTLYNNEKKLCPVLWACPGGWLSIMQRVDRVCNDDDEIKMSFMSNYPYFKDFKSENFGILDGRLVAIDYGH